MDRLSEIRARCEAATPGEWQHNVIDDAGGVIDHAVGIGLTHGICCGISNPSDAAFIAHARDDISYLLARIEKAEAERDTYKAALQNWHEEGDRP